jgi:DNA-binding NarL/FixJ family response regulator
MAGRMIDTQDPERLDGWTARYVRPLAPHQLRMVRLLATGMTIKAAAHEYGCTYYTAKHIVASVHRRLGTDNIVGVLLALGWLEVPDHD